jgi:hypothetical protein
LGAQTDSNATNGQRRIAIGRGAVSQADGEIAIGSSSYNVLTAATAGATSTYLVVRINGTQYKIALQAVV